MNKDRLFRKKEVGKGYFFKYLLLVRKKPKRR